MSLRIRPGKADDLYNLTDINTKWQRINLKNIANGFLSAALDEEAFKMIIARKEILVAETETKVLVGYYLLVNSAIQEVFINHLSKVKELKFKNQIPASAIIGLGAQVLIDKQFQRTGIRAELLAEFRNYLKGEYDYLFSTISKENTRALRAHLHDGWEILEENEDVYFVSLEVR